SWSAGGVGGGQRRRPFRNRRGDHDRGGGVAVGEEPVEDRLQLFDGGGGQVDQETVVAGDPVGLGEVRGFGGQLGDLGQAAGHGPDPGERGDREADRGRIDVQLVAGDDPGAFQPLQSFGDGGRGHAYPAGQLSGRQPRAGLQLGEQPE